MAGRIRAFLALALEGPALAEAGRRLEAMRRGSLGERARFVRPEGLHVTLRFLGAIDSASVAPLATAVGDALAGFAPFPLRLGALHLFPSPRRPRVLAIGLEPEEPLSALAAAVARGVEAAGFSPEPRAFRAHVTLARFREGARPGAEVLDVATFPAAFVAHEVLLFESRPGPGGSVYTPLERLPLHGPASTQP